jgi:hypothetical protein
MKKIGFNDILRTAALAGNALFVLWILFNAMDSGWRGTKYEIVSSLGLIFLLLLNTYFLARRNTK